VQSAHIPFGSADSNSTPCSFARATWQGHAARRAGPGHRPVPLERPATFRQQLGRTSCADRDEPPQSQHSEGRPGQRDKFPVVFTASSRFLSANSSIDSASVEENNLLCREHRQAAGLIEARPGCLRVRRRSGHRPGARGLRDILLDQLRAAGNRVKIWLSQAEEPQGRASLFFQRDDQVVLAPTEPSVVSRHGSNQPFRKILTMRSRAGSCSSKSFSRRSKFVTHCETGSCPCGRKRFSAHLGGA